MGEVKVSFVSKKISFVSLLIFVFAGTMSTSLLGETDKEGKEMAEDKTYTENDCHKKFAVDLNNLVWSLLGKSERTQDENEKMVHAAYASLYHWGVVGTPVNVQRGEWLISHVYSLLNRSELALYHGARCMELTEKHGLQDFDLAYAYEAMARAHAAVGNEAECKRYVKLAQEAGEKIKEEEDKALFFDDFKAEPWYGMRER